MWTRMQEIAMLSYDKLLHPSSHYFCVYLNIWIYYTGLYILRNISEMINWTTHDLLTYNNYFNSLLSHFIKSCTLLNEDWIVLGKQVGPVHALETRESTQKKSYINFGKCCFRVSSRNNTCMVVEFYSKIWCSWNNLVIGNWTLVRRTVGRKTVIGVDSRSASSQKLDSMSASSHKLDSRSATSYQNMQLSG